MSRKVGGRRPRSAILIVCEGAKTEPQYFKGFRLSSVEVVGAGKNTLSLVEHAFRISEGYDQTWCVFDRDSFPAQTFNAAIQKAATHGFKWPTRTRRSRYGICSTSIFHTSALSRTLYEQKLTERLGRPYKKNDPTMFDALRGDRTRPSDMPVGSSQTTRQPTTPSRTTLALPCICSSRS